MKVGKKGQRGKEKKGKGREIEARLKMELKILGGGGIEQIQTNEGIIFPRGLAETITRGGMEKGDTGANRPETPAKAGNDIDTSFSLISPSGKHWFSTHAELRAPPPLPPLSLSPPPFVSCSIDTNVERIEANRTGDGTWPRCHATNLLVASPAITITSVCGSNGGG